jgi:hypothetical protein
VVALGACLIVLPTGMRMIVLGRASRQGGMVCVTNHIGGGRGVGSDRLVGTDALAVPLVMVAVTWVVVALDVVLAGWWWWCRVGRIVMVVVYQ